MFLLPLVLPMLLLLFRLLLLVPSLSGQSTHILPFGSLDVLLCTGIYWWVERCSGICSPFSPPRRYGISLEKATCVSYAKKLAIKFHFMISVCVLVRWHVNLLRQFMRKSRDSCSTLRGTKKEQEPEGATGYLAVQSLFAMSFCHSSKVCTNRTPINQHATPTMTHSTSIFY